MPGVMPASITDLSRQYSFDLQNHHEAACCRCQSSYRRSCSGDTLLVVSAMTDSKSCRVIGRTSWARTLRTACIPPPKIATGQKMLARQWPKYQSTKSPWSDPPVWKRHDCFAGCACQPFATSVAISHDALLRRVAALECVVENAARRPNQCPTDNWYTLVPRHAE
jgi:hypothetical protein